jgi:hypothetical protein
MALIPFLNDESFFAETEALRSADPAQHLIS